MLVRLANDAAIVDALPGDAVVLEGAGEPIAIAAARLGALRERIVAAVSEFHATSPDEPGLGRARLHRIAMPGAPPDLWAAILKDLIDDGALVRNGAYLRRPDHRVQLSERELELAAKLMPRIAAGGFDPPWVRDLASAIEAPEDEVRQTLRKLNAEGSVQQVVRDLFYAPERVRELAAIARRIADAARRDRSGGLSRRDRSRPQAHDPDLGVLRSRWLHSTRPRCAPDSAKACRSELPSREGKRIR